MRAIGWIVAGGVAVVLGAAGSIGVALRLHLLERDDVMTERAWVEANGKECLVERRFERVGSTSFYYRFYAVKKAQSREVKYKVGGLSSAVGAAVRGDEGDRPDVAFKKDSNTLTVIEAGWPLRCLRQREWTSHVGCFVDRVASEGRVEWDAADGITVPGQPMWGGLAADTVMFGSPWMAGFLLVGWVRRARRRRRGSCAACGYSKQGLERGACCPECGLG